MIKYYYASITDKNIYIEDQNLLEYLNAYFPNLSRYYENIFSKNSITDLNTYKNKRIEFNKLIEQEGLSPYLLIKSEKGQLREINTNTLFTLNKLKKSKIKRISNDQFNTLYNASYKTKVNRYIYLPYALDNNPVFELEYEEPKKVKKITKIKAD